MHGWVGWRPAAAALPSALTPAGLRRRRRQVSDSMWHCQTSVDDIPGLSCAAASPADGLPRPDSGAGAGWAARPAPPLFRALAPALPSPACGPAPGLAPGPLALAMGVIALSAVLLAMSRAPWMTCASSAVSVDCSPSSWRGEEGAGMVLCGCAGGCRVPGGSLCGCAAVRVGGQVGGWVLGPGGEPGSAPCARTRDALQAAPSGRGALSSKMGKASRPEGGRSRAGQGEGARGSVATQRQGVR